MTKSDLSSATATVELVIEIPSGSTWGPTCTLDQIYRQAGDGARNHVENIFRKEGTRVRILSSKVTAVAAVKDPRS
jgi:hypothetical protein